MVEDHIEPDKFRPISLHGEMFRGLYNFDWQEVSHIQRLRSRYPAGRDDMRLNLGPYPQGMTQEELVRNRNFDRSHGSGQFPSGMIRVGSQVLML